MFIRIGENRAVNLGNITDAEATDRDSNGYVNKLVMVTVDGRRIQTADYYAAAAWAVIMDLPEPPIPDQDKDINNLVLEAMTADAWENYK